LLLPWDLQHWDRTNPELPAVEEPLPLTWWREGDRGVGAGRRRPSAAGGRLSNQKSRSETLSQKPLRASLVSVTRSRSRPT
jgi:hypothetical protein